MITRTELSADPEMRSEAVGLKRREVTGKSWAWRIVMMDCNDVLVGKEEDGRGDSLGESLRLVLLHSDLRIQRPAAYRPRCMSSYQCMANRSRAEGLTRCRKQ